MDINCGRGREHDVLLSPENTCYQDVNSTALLYFRWFLLINLIGGLFIGNAYLPLLELGYLCSIIPAISFMFFENLLFFWHTDNYMLNNSYWFIARLIFAVLNTITVILWMIYKQNVILFFPWVTSMFIISIEAIISCHLNDKCCQSCKSRYRESS